MGIFKKFKSLFKKAKKLPTSVPTDIGTEVGAVEKTKKEPVKKPPVRKKSIQGVYRVLKTPHISEKATILAERNKYVFKICPNTNKVEVKKAIQNLYGVKVENVNIINVHRKQKTLRGIKGFKSGYKKAIITLEKGQKIEILPH